MGAGLVIGGIGTGCWPVGGAVSHLHVLKCVCLPAKGEEKASGKPNTGPAALYLCSVLIVTSDTRRWFVCRWPAQASTPVPYVHSRQSLPALGPAPTVATKPGNGNASILVVLRTLSCPLVSVSVHHSSHGVAPPVSGAELIGARFSRNTRITGLVVGAVLSSSDHLLLLSAQIHSFVCSQLSRSNQLGGRHDLISSIRSIATASAVLCVVTTFPPLLLAVECVDSAGHGGLNGCCRLSMPYYLDRHSSLDRSMFLVLANQLECTRVSR